MLKLKDIKNKNITGTYVAVKYAEDSCKAIVKLAKQLKLKNILSEDDIHSTIIFSRTEAVGLVASQEDYPATVSCKKLHTFTTSDDKVAVVVLLNAPVLQKRHEYIMKNYNTTYDHDEYQPHITLSYENNDFDISKFDGDFPELTIISEYVEDLDLNWKDNVTTTN